MSLPKKVWKNNRVKKFAEASLEKPGMYLIALRSHVRRGKTIIGNMLDSVTVALPQPQKVQPADEV